MWLGKAHLENLPILRSAMPMSGCPRWLTGKESGSQYRRHGLDPWVRKIPWRKKWQPTPVFLPGESHGQRSLAGYSPWHCKGSDMTEWVTHSQRNIVWSFSEGKFYFQREWEEMLEEEKGGTRSPKPILTPQLLPRPHWTRTQVFLLWARTFKGKTKTSCWGYS